MKIAIIDSGINHYCRNRVLRWAVPTTQSAVPEFRSQESGARIGTRATKNSCFLFA